MMKLVVCIALFLCVIGSVKAEFDEDSIASSTTGFLSCDDVPTGELWDTVGDCSQVEGSVCLGSCNSFTTGADYNTFNIECEVVDEVATWMYYVDATGAELDSDSAATICVFEDAGNDDGGATAIVTSFPIQAGLDEEEVELLSLALLEEIAAVLDIVVDALRELVTINYIEYDDEVIVEAIVAKLEVIFESYENIVPSNVTAELSSDDLHAAFIEVWTDDSSELFVSGYVSTDAQLNTLQLVQCSDGSYQDPCPNLDDDGNEEEDYFWLYVILIILVVLIILFLCCVYNNYKSKSASKFDDIQLDPMQMMNQSSKPLPVPQFAEGGLADGDNDDDVFLDDEDPDARVHVTIG